YYVMELLQGLDLQEMVKRFGPLPAERAVWLLEQACRSLVEAHERGLVHRDIKPENILLDASGRVKVADFGLARVASAAMPALTQSGEMLGTARYMSPEQMENPASVDARADLFSAAVVLYEMLTGERPLGRFEPPSKKVAIDPRWDDVVLKALSREPDRRYSTAGELRTAIARVVSEKALPAPPRRRWWIAVPIVALLAVAAIFAPRAFRKAPETRTAANPPPKTEAAPSLDALVFADGEGPLGDTFAGACAELPDNPLSARTPAELDQLVKFVRGWKFFEVDRSELEAGYAARWSTMTLVALVSPAAEKIERRIGTGGNRWTHRDGRLLVVVLSGVDTREEFVDLVNRTRKKLGVPETPLPLPIRNLELDRNDLPKGWSFAEEVEGIRSPVTGLAPDERAPVLAFLNESAHTAEGELSAVHAAGFRRGAGAAEIGLIVVESDTKAAVLERRLPEHPRLSGAKKVVTMKSGISVAVLFLRSDDFGALEKLAILLRRRMGLPAMTFDTIVPTDAEWPPEFKPERVVTEVRAVLRDAGLADVRVDDVPRACRAVARGGTVLLLEVPDSDARSGIQRALRSSGEVWSERKWVCAVSSPDADVRKALRNRMHEKMGLDPIR
ncbi:MAG: serine/threonine protein kinase, partial [Planctomycetes bacterium]|nr:serine/threonine protein kinase [Planctomycetota bacterium]